MCDKLTLAQLIAKLQALITEEGFDPNCPV